AARTWPRPRPLRKRLWAEAGLSSPLSGLFCGFGDASAARRPFAPLPRLTPHPQLGPEGPGGEIRRRKPRNQVQGEKRETKGMDSPPAHPHFCSWQQLPEAPGKGNLITM
ncbi:unnamed protein product, partial [Gulo gulo]